MAHITSRDQNFCHGTEPTEPQCHHVEAKALDSPLAGHQALLQKSMRQGRIINRFSKDMSEIDKEGTAVLKA